MQNFLEYKKENGWKNLTQIVGTNDFHLIKQGIVSTNEGNNFLNGKKIKYGKYEVLLRVSENGNNVDLSEFLSNIEKNNLEFQLDIVVLERTLLKIVENQTNGDNSIYQINLYPATFCDVYFKEFISYLIEKTKVNTRNLVFELLESGRSCKDFCGYKDNCGGTCLISENIEYLMSEYQIKIAIDDFGNGNNNSTLLEMINGYKIVKFDGMYLDRLIKTLDINKLRLKLNLLIECLSKKGIEEITFEKVDTIEKFLFFSTLNKYGLRFNYQGWLFNKGTKL